MALYLHALRVDPDPDKQELRLNTHRKDALGRLKCILRRLQINFNHICIAADSIAEAEERLVALVHMPSDTVHARLDLADSRGAVEISAHIKGFLYPEKMLSLQWLGVVLPPNTNMLQYLHREDDGGNVQWDVDLWEELLTPYPEHHTQLERLIESGIAAAMLSGKLDQWVWNLPKYLQTLYRLFGDKGNAMRVAANIQSGMSHSEARDMEVIHMAAALIRPLRDALTERYEKAMCKTRTASAYAIQGADLTPIGDKVVSEMVAAGSMYTLNRSGDVAIITVTVIGTEMQIILVEDEEYNEWD